MLPAVYFRLKPTFKLKQIPPAAVTSQNSHVAENLLCASYNRNEEKPLGLHLVAEGSTQRVPGESRVCHRFLMCS